jgi:hypothetical protein
MGVQFLRFESTVSSRTALLAGMLAALGITRSPFQDACFQVKPTRTSGTRAATTPRNSRNEQPRPLLQTNVATRQRGRRMPDKPERAELDRVALAKGIGAAPRIIKLEELAAAVDSQELEAVYFDAASRGANYPLLRRLAALKRQLEGE